jgi:hypothetical protein
VNLDAIPWTVAEGRTEDSRPLLIRFREVSRAFPRELFSRRINIFWKMVQPRADGLPTDAESERLKAFEDRLVSAVEPSNEAVLSVVLTAAGVREWVFHTGHVDRFLTQLTEMPQEVERYPVELHANDDPGWEYDDSVTEIHRTQ